MAAEIVRRGRSLWRKLFHPRGPWWWPMRLSNVALIVALSGCDLETARARDQHMTDGALAAWLEGY